MTMKLFVGSSALIGAVERYAQRLDFLEVLAEDKTLPVPRTLRRWRETVPATFQFSVVLPRDVAALTPGTEQNLERALETAKTLAASFVLVRTPPAVAPSERGRRRLSELFAKLKPAAARIAWEPRGVWTPEDADAFAQESGVFLVRDLAQDDAPESTVVYTRLLSIGQHSRLGQSAIERVAERLSDAEEAYVVVDGRGAPGVARRLRAELALAQPEGDEEEDDDGDEEDGDDEDSDDEDGDDEDAE